MSTANQIITVPAIVDGFSYNNALQYLPCRYWPHALQQLDTLRRAVGYRVRWITVPDDQGEPIQPFETYYYQASLANGSFLYAYCFASMSATNGGSPVATTASDLNVNITDSCTEVPLFLDLANGAGLAPTSTFNSRAPICLLSKPRLILDPGLVNVEIANHTPNTITCQLVLFFAESCKIITEELREKEWARVAPFSTPAPRNWGPQWP